MQNTCCFNSDDVTCICVEISDTKSHSFVDIRREKNEEMFGDQKKVLGHFFPKKKFVFFCDDAAHTRVLNQSKENAHIFVREKLLKKLIFLRSQQRKSKAEFGTACIRANKAFL